MDKAPQQLDPKLKEAYDRVMGTVITPKDTTGATQSVPQQPTTTQSGPTTLHQSAQATPPTLIPQEKNGFVRKKKGISPLIIFLGVVAFLAVYAFVWIKIFNVQLF
jgi:hypothetical protein